MNKKAFTLIELLAVIVILAIIALIATPIILNIIEDSKDSANTRSKELYLHSVEISLASKNVTENFEPTTCTVKSDGNLTCDVGDLTVETSGSKPKAGGTITFKDGKITGNTLEFGNELKEEQPAVKKIGKAVTEENKTLAGNIPQGNFEKGDEYIINVDGTHEYHFYVLSTEGDKVNLIMSNNICSDGNLATSSNICTIEWASKEDFINEKYNYSYYSSVNGPITAMDYIYQATKNWSNISNIQMNYTKDSDNNNHVYGEIITDGSTTKITTIDGIVTRTYENLKARLIMKNETVYDENGNCKKFLVNGMSPYPEKYPVETKEDIEGIDGYWSLATDIIVSSYDDAFPSNAYYIASDGNLASTGSDKKFGIRPVIEISKSELQ